jgi:hypothetical protein
VTGLATNGSYLYGAGVDAQTSPPKEVVERFSLSGALQTGPFLMTDLGIEFYDIAFLDNEIWYAVEDASEPVQVFNSSGTKTFSISSSIVPAAHGMTFDADGCLWVADADADQIYKVDLDPQGTGGATGALLPPAASVSAAENPFSGTVTIELSGFAGPAAVRVVDMAGRTVASGTASGTFVWDGVCRDGFNAPAGTYSVIADDGAGGSAATRVVKLR